MTRRIKIPNRRGDTIVEVMIVLAVLATAFAISYATASRGLDQSRNSQEHTQALGAVNTQVELVRKAVQQQLTELDQYTTGGVNAGKSFCITSSNVTGSAVSPPISDPDSLTTGGPNTYPPECIQNSLYYQSVAYDAGQKDFVVTTHWDGIGTLGRQSVQLAYRAQKLQNNQYTTVTLASSPAKIDVLVQKISPDSSAYGQITPSCGSSNSRVIRDTSSITLTNTNGAHNSSDTPTTQSHDTSSSIWSFSNLYERDSYQATVTPPAQYQTCFKGVAGTSATSDPVVALPGNSQQINSITIRPICSTHTWQTQVRNDIRHDDPYPRYEWHLTSSNNVRGEFDGNPNTTDGVGSHWYNPNDDRSPDAWDATYPNSHYGSGYGGRAGWAIRTVWFNSNLYRVGWFANAGWYGYWIYDDWWDQWENQRIYPDGVNTWWEEHYDTVNHREDICPA